MKTPLLVLASLALGTAAFAQDTQSAPAAGVEPPAATAPSTPPGQSDAPPLPTSDASLPPATNTSAPDTTVAPPAPADTTVASSTDTSNYPMCSRSITDKCVQRHHR